MPTDPDDEPIELDDVLEEAQEQPVDLTDEASAQAAAPEEAEDDPLELIDEPLAPGEKPKIQQLGRDAKAADQRQWRRTPNADGRGAVRVKTFYVKLRADAIESLDDQVNRWLDEHPEYEVKFATTAIGELYSKTSEPALFMNVWV